MNFEPFKLILILLACAAGFSLLIYAMVYAMAGRRASKRYRPGRPFDFRPVWFVAAPERQARAGISARPATGRELAASQGTPRVTRPAQTGGASDRW